MKKVLNYQMNVAVSTQQLLMLQSFQQKLEEHKLLSAEERSALSSLEASFKDALSRSATSPGQVTEILNRRN
jgi:hypothetical protein